MAKSNLDWEASPAEKYAERWWKKNGFDVKLLKRYQSKSIYEISRDGLTRKEEIPYTVKKFGEYMKQFQEGWDMLVEIENMKRQLAAQQQ
jgi:hypothetical protein